MTEPQNAFPKAELTTNAKQLALEMKARILSGEKIPIEEIRAFILKADFDLETTRIKTATKEKISDVDFF